ncbi:hypothetical protein ACQY0O_007278 [Thecaphora frezii]
MVRLYALAAVVTTLSVLARPTSAQLSISLADAGTRSSAPPSPTLTLGQAGQPANDGSVSVVPDTPTVPLNSTSAADPLPAVAQGNATYHAPPPASSTTTIDVSALPNSLPASNRTVSSNFTLPSATATATFPSLPTLNSLPYQFVVTDPSGLPRFTYNLTSLEQRTKEALCAQQIDFCAKAGCEQEDDGKKKGGEVKLINFCETKYMGVACRCSRGAARLQQYSWPVMLADCRGRNTACIDACQKPNAATADKNQCFQACRDNFETNCGRPGQMAADYSVRKEGQKPSYKVIQGGDAQNAAWGAIRLRGAMYLAKT